MNFALKYFSLLYIPYIIYYLSITYIAYFSPLYIYICKKFFVFRFTATQRDINI
nr:MAG TPA: hypothetical protein [Caudoviricetes sp.]